MLRFIRQLSGGAAASPEPRIESIVLKEPPDRRKVSGDRVTCKCEFILPNPDPFMHSRMLVTGVMVLNVRGCCVYPDQVMSVEELKRKVPESKALEVSKLVITGSDGQKFPLSSIAVRRVRLLNDEHGQGVILRFSNLTETQLDMLNQITDLYAEKN